MKLSIIILNYNVRHFLELCLKSVEGAIQGLNAEVIVVDNNSTDDSVATVRKLFPKVQVIVNKVNYGFSKGNNIGVEKANGEYICILNPDTVVAEDSFIKLLNFAESKDNLGVVGCNLVNGMGEFLPESKRNVPYPMVALKKIFGNSSSYYANHLREGQIGEVDILVGAFMLMKKNLFVSVTGFDEDFFMYGEDIDLSYRIRKLGFNNYYFGGTSIIHFKGESTLRDRVYLKRFFGAMKIFYEKHFKKNFLVDLFVQAGIQLAFVIDTRRFPRNMEVVSYTLVSNEINEKLKRKLSKTIGLASMQDDKLKKNYELIFDAHYVSYKDIIRFMINNRKTGFSYKILPRNSNFILGSNSGFCRGEIIKF